MHVSFRSFFYVFSFLFFLCMLNATACAKADPDVLLKQITQELLTTLRSEEAQIQAAPNRLYAIIDKILVPYVDWDAMSHWVIGRSAWAQASDLQRQRFSQAFKKLLIRTYASTLRAYRNQTIEYLPVRGGIDGKSRIQVSSLIKEPGRETIRVTYRLADKGTQWKVYDIAIEGVSLLKGFQAQFATELKQNGLDKLIQRLQQHNEKAL